MESYLTEIKQLRIPRPKYEPNGSPTSNWRRYVRPYTPPQDYNLPANEITPVTPTRKFQGGAEEFRTTPQDNTM